MRTSTLDINLRLDHEKIDTYILRTIVWNFLISNFNFFIEILSLSDIDNFESNDCQGGRCPSYFLRHSWSA